MKKKRFSKVKAVKAAAREHIGMPKSTTVVPNKKEKRLKKITKDELKEAYFQIFY